MDDIALHCFDRVLMGDLFNIVFMVMGLADTCLSDVLDFFAVALSISTFAFFHQIISKKGGTNLGLGFLTSMMIVLL